LGTLKHSEHIYQYSKFCLINISWAIHKVLQLNTLTKLSSTRERGRERESERSGEVVRDTIFGGSKKERIYMSVLKVPRQCPLVLLVEAAHMIGIRFIIIIILLCKSGRAALWCDLN
jgi:hypothetical protein